MNQRQAGTFSKQGNDKKGNNIYTLHNIEKMVKAVCVPVGKITPGKS
jgi:hypothetical protein